MKIIYTKNGREVLVDDEDYEKLNQWKWNLNSVGYARRTIRYTKNKGNYKTIFMHKILLQLNSNKNVEHSDRNKLNNQKGNLRECSQSENLANRCKISKRRKYKGVHQVRNRWFAQIGVNGSQICLGGFSTPELAAWAYNLKAKELYGDFAQLNKIEIDGQEIFKT